MKLTSLLALTELFSFTLSTLLLDNIIRQLPVRTHPQLYCVIQPALRNDPLRNLYQLNANLGQQQFVIAEPFVRDIVTVRCSHYVVSFDERCLGSAEKLIERFFLRRVLNNGGYFIFLADSSRKSKEFYKKTVQEFGITNSALIIWENSVRYYGLDYFGRNLVEFSSEDEMMHHLKGEFLRDVKEHVFRVGFVESVPSAVRRRKLGGSAVMLMQTFAKHINASLVWNFNFDKVKDHQMAEMVVPSKIDIVPNMFLDHPIIENIPGHLPESLVLIVPETLKGSFFEHLLVPFSTGVWLVILVVIISVLIANRILDRFLPRNLPMILCFRSPISEHDLKKAERLTYVSLSIIMFLLKKYYLAIMISYTLSQKYGDHLQTITDFERSNIPICTFPKKDTTYLENFSKFISIDLKKHIIARYSTNDEWYFHSALPSS